MPDIKIQIDTETGELHIEVQGIKGPACEAIAKLAAEYLGEPTSDRQTPEYREQSRARQNLEARS